MVGTPQERLTDLRDSAGVSPDLLDLESRLLAWRSSLIPKCRTDYPAQKIDAELIARAFGTGELLARSLDSSPTVELLTEAFVGFTPALADLPLAGELSRWLGGNTKPLGAKLDAWFTAAWQADAERLTALSQEAQIEADLLHWAGRQFAKPFFHVLGEAMDAARPADLDATHRPGCPCCGGAPRFARYESQEGQRRLWCDLCDLEWAFRRLTCAFCGTTDQKQLGYLVIEDVAQYRLDVCEVCKGYLRTLDQRQAPEGGPVDFLHEDVGTVHLCMVAEGKGYQQGAPRT